MIVGVLNVHPEEVFKVKNDLLIEKDLPLNSWWKTFIPFVLWRTNKPKGQVEPTGNHHSQTNISIKLVAYNSKKKIHQGL